MVKKKNNNSNSKYYIVKNNDNIRDIAKKYNMSWTKLYNKNKNIIDEKAIEHGRFTNSYNYLYEGTKLIIGE